MAKKKKKTQIQGTLVSPLGQQRPEMIKACMNAGGVGAKEREVGIVL